LWLYRIGTGNHLPEDRGGGREERHPLFRYGGQPKTARDFAGPPKGGEVAKSFALAISHFHNDHIANFAYFSSCEVYGSKQTGKYVRVDHEVTGPVDLDLGDVVVTLLPLPSSHAKGSIIAVVKAEKVAYLGDGVYEAVGFEKPYYDRSLFYEMSRVLRSLNITHYVFGHESILTRDDQIGMEAFLKETEAKIKAAGTPRLYLDGD
jgi:glyoxylase-like metal-dependent hydrolase (beta-lactamase superfamily II)